MKRAIFCSVRAIAANAMGKVQLLLHEGICHTRAVAIDEHGQPVRTYLSAQFDAALKLGEIIEASVSKVSPSDGGYFMRVNGKREGFMAHRAADDLVEGQKLLCRVAAEPRADKLARLLLAPDVDNGVERPDALRRWRASLPTKFDSDFETGNEAIVRIDEVFEDALLPICGLENGGRLQITPTPALVAIDIDTIGRQDTGRASLRARVVNVEAAAVAGRQLALRNLGGNVVLDCIGPLAKRDASTVKVAFVDSFRSASKRKISCLPPSPLGMMEDVIEHGARPIAEMFYREQRGPTSLGQLLTSLRRIEIEATLRRADLLYLYIPRAGYEMYRDHKKMIDDALQSRFGGRIIIVESSTNKTEISSR